MNENQANMMSLVDTTDCLEAVGVFRVWKNCLFLVSICCFLLLQMSFWLVDGGFIETRDGTYPTKATLPMTDQPPPVGLPTTDEIMLSIKDKRPEQLGDPSKVEQSENKTITEPNQLVEAVPRQDQSQKSRPRLAIKFRHLALLIRFVSYVLIVATSLYCRTMLFTLNTSMSGRLGGINHIARAFFLSLALIILILPWQKFFFSEAAGTLYTAEELFKSCAAAHEKDGLFSGILHYLRFTGSWVFVLLLLILSQLRSMRWVRAVLRRLETI
jgi:hypothetical protein